LDSVQLWPDLIGVTRVVDLGSGAGLPGLVLGACGIPDLHLVEADQRKAVFLRDAARVMGVPATVHATRAETLTPLAATAATARALAPLDDLLDYAARHLVHGGKLIALKGERWADELRAAERRWRFTATHRPSLVDPAGAVLILEAPRRA
jgi:16S rRNA (guanine527-N7)-methyltransferase